METRWIHIWWCKMGSHVYNKPHRRIQNTCKYAHVMTRIRPEPINHNVCKWHDAYKICCAHYFIFPTRNKVPMICFIWLVRVLRTNLFVHIQMCWIEDMECSIFNIHSLLAIYIPGLSGPSDQKWHYPFTWLRCLQWSKVKWAPKI